jgi:histidinol dehydrogenase
VRITHLGPDASAADVRPLTQPPEGLEESVRSIIEEVRAGGDAAVRSLTARFDHAEVEPGALQVPYAEIEGALGIIERDVVEAMRVAFANVREVAEAQVGTVKKIVLDAGQRIEVEEVPVQRAAAYAPGGRAPYPSTVIMCAAVARAAGVEELVVCAPPGPGGRAHPAILAACAVCGVHEVHRMGGAQAIAALAYGTESVRPVDVIAGPGNAWVQEAKRQVAGVVGIDSPVAGPSELVVVATLGADVELVALDLMAQAEHGPDTLLAVISHDEALLAAVEAALHGFSEQFDTVHDAPLAVIRTADVASAVRLAEWLADRVRRAGGVFIGRDAATAFGDYVAGSNHVLPTGGAARFASALSPVAFRRRMARVSLTPGAAARLAPPGAALARAEGFLVHAESMERRA